MAYISFLCWLVFLWRLWRKDRETEGMDEDCRPFTLGESQWWCPLVRGFVVGRKRRVARVLKRHRYRDGIKQYHKLISHIRKLSTETNQSNETYFLFRTWIIRILLVASVIQCYSFLASSWYEVFSVTTCFKCMRVLPSGHPNIVWVERLQS